MKFAIPFLSWTGRAALAVEIDASYEYLSESVKLGAAVRVAFEKRADLSGANLSDAYLSGANLSCADLSNAYLSRAIGIAPDRIQPLRLLRHQPGPIRLFKLVDADLRSPMRASGNLRYDIGSAIEVPDANTDEDADCAAGVNVATLDWCLKKWREGWRILIVEFTAADIAAIPHSSDGKLRLYCCKVVEEWKFDPVDMGPVKPEKVEAA